MFLEQFSEQQNKYFDNKPLPIKLSGNIGTRIMSNGNNMKALLALIIVSTTLPANAAILAGPVTNPANSHTYYLLSKTTWSNGEAEAVALGGHLATIRNADEQQWVFSTFSTYGGALWIGLTDRDKLFTFTWTSGEPLLYTNWDNLQPDNGTGGIEFYVQIWPTDINPSARLGSWNDYGDFDDIWGAPCYGVAEISQATPTRPPALHAASNPSFTAIELSWASETNKLYRVQWTPSLDQTNWTPLEPEVSGTGANVSIFDSTTEHTQRFYRIIVVR